MSSQASSFAAPVDRLYFMSEQFPPYNYQEDGKARGISIEIVGRVLQQLNAETTINDIQFLPWARSYRVLQNRKNTALFVTVRTASREKLFQWAGPLSRARNVLLARKDRHIQIHTAQDLLRFQIGAVRDDAGGQLVEKKLGIPRERLDISSDAIFNIRKLKLGRIDLFAYDENVAHWLIRKEGLNPADFETVYVLEEGLHYIAFNKETDPTLIRDIQRALDGLRTDGSIDRITQKYLGP